RAALGFSGLGVSIIAVDGEKVALLEEALAVLPDDRPLRARVLARLAIETFYASGPERRNQLGDEAVASARRSGDDQALLQALNARRVALWSPANLEERLEADGEMIELAQRAGDVEAVLQARNWRVADLAELGDIDGMLAEVDAHEELAEELRLPSYQWWAPMWRCSLVIQEGRFAEATELIDSYERLALRIGDPNAGLHVGLQRVAVSELREAWGEIDDSWLHAALGTPSEQTWRTTYSWIYAEQGRGEASREQLELLSSRDFTDFPDDMNKLCSLSELTRAF